jgi:uncharacterized protein (TIGR03435 family)
MEIWKTMRKIVVTGLIACSISLFGQPAATPPAFEVASVKLAPPATGNGIRVSMGGDAGRVSYSNVTLRNVMTQAYKVKDRQISGPDWLDSERYDIVAKIPADTPKDQVPLMLQTLLAERFKLALHREQKVMPVYALVAGKNGAKLHEASSEAGGFRMSMGPKGRQLTGNASISALSDVLSRFMDRPVLDMTGIKGVFEISLEWTPDDSRSASKFGLGAPGPGRPEVAAEGKATDSADAPSIFTAVQEKLGLRLEAKKLPIEILVVDHVEKVPTEN